MYFGGTILNSQVGDVLSKYDMGSTSKILDGNKIVHKNNYSD
jgi:hypothetical protein